MLEGFCCVEVAGVPPGKDQFQVVGFPVELSVKFTQPFGQILVELAVKFATTPGGAVPCKLMLST